MVSLLSKIQSCVKRCISYSELNEEIKDAPPPIGSNYECAPLLQIVACGPQNVGFSDNVGTYWKDIQGTEIDVLDHEYSVIVSDILDANASLLTILTDKLYPDNCKISNIIDRVYIKFQYTENYSNRPFSERIVSFSGFALDHANTMTGTNRAIHLVRDMECNIYHIKFPFMSTINGRYSNLIIRIRFKDAIRHSSLKIKGILLDSRERNLLYKPQQFVNLRSSYETVIHVDEDADGNNIYELDITKLDYMCNIISGLFIEVQHVNIDKSIRAVQDVKVILNSHQYFHGNDHLCCSHIPETMYNVVNNEDNLYFVPFCANPKNPERGTLNVSRFEKALLQLNFKKSGKYKLKMSWSIHMNISRVQSTSSPYELLPPDEGEDYVKFSNTVLKHADTVSYDIQKDNPVTINYGGYEDMDILVIYDIMESPIAYIAKKDGTCSKISPDVLNGFTLDVYYEKEYLKLKCSKDVTVNVSIVV